MSKRTFQPSKRKEEISTVMDRIQQMEEKFLRVEELKEDIS
jgi:hypothetical protein